MTLREEMEAIRFRFPWLGLVSLAISFFIPVYPAASAAGSKCRCESVRWFS